MSKQSQDHLIHELVAVINRFRYEYELTVSEAVGCIELLKADLIREAFADEDDE